jgi:2-polyprenyl-3-methyl-5-hydroxy-6-metoxy-1,4-benzoquinol methylase/uncharacterized protein YbaR (Trm112 family)
MRRRARLTYAGPTKKLAPSAGGSRRWKKHRRRLVDPAVSEATEAEVAGGRSAPARLELVCPACMSGLDAAEFELSCTGCGRAFPVVAGIPDLRLSYPDAYLSWQEDLDRARELEERGGELDFAGLLREHWRRSGKPEELAERFVVADVSARTTAYLAEIERGRGAELRPGNAFLEVGCGSAGLAAPAARRGCRAVASDLSMRWLVLAKKRLAEEGIEDVQLVCCAAEDLPFAEGAFDVVAASDVIEHVASSEDLLAGCQRVLRRGGMLFLATPNRFSLSLEPHVRLWGVGWLPRPLAKAYVEAVRRTSYDHVRLLSARSLRRILRRAGFDPCIVPPEIPASSQRMYSGIELRLVRVYNRLRKLAPIRLALLAVGPFFHVFAIKR